MAAASALLAASVSSLISGLDKCSISRRDEFKYVANHFVRYLVARGLIRKPAIMAKENVLKLFVAYQSQYPSHVKTTEIIKALREAGLLKKKKVTASGDNEDIEFKNLIFRYTDAGDFPDDIQKPRLKTITDQNQKFKNKLTKDAEIKGLECLLCREKFENDEQLHDHTTTRAHFLRKTYRDKRTSFLKRIDGLEITNALEVNFTIHRECRKKILFKNTTSRKITFLNVKNLFEYDGISLIYETPTSIGADEVFSVELKACFNRYDAKKYPIVVEMSYEDSGAFVDLLLEPRYVVLDADLDDLKPITPYEPVGKNVEVVLDLPVISGIPLPKVKGTFKNKVPMKPHEIPQTFRKILNHGFKEFSGMNVLHNKKIQEMRDLLLDQEKNKVLPNAKALNPQNYVNRFRHLMWIEEHQLEKDIHSYNLKEISITKEYRDMSFLAFEVPGLLEHRPSVIKGDSVYILFPNGKVKYEGVVHIVEQSKLLVLTNSVFFEKYIGQKVNVEFSFNRCCLKISHRALDQVEKHQVADLMFPARYGLGKKVIVSKNDILLYNSLIKNNDQQMQAVVNIVNNSAFPAPFLIYGPPGTGKTATMVEAIKQIWKLIPSAKICVCAPSNAAADVVAERLLLSLPSSNILRFYSLSRTEVPENLRQCCNFDGNEMFMPSEAALKMKRIVILTPIAAGRLISAGFTGGHFDFLFIDEAGHAIETEMIVPIVGLLTNTERVGITGSLVLAGDPKQLGPVVRSSLAVNLGYGMSLLERLIDHNPLYQKDPQTSQYNSNVMVKLINNYRSHQVILHVPNKLFYDDKLLAKGPLDKITIACRWEELPKRNFPMIFHGVKGVEDREQNSPSYFNRLEIQTLMGYVRKLLTETRLSGYKVKQEDIGIIAPYRKQVQKIRQQLSKSFSKVDVASVEEFQGQEKLIIIISTVRSRAEFIASDYKFGLGFLRSEKRFNVAVTRAKALLIVIGNPDVLQCDTRWRTLMEYCAENGSYRGEKATDKIASDFDVNDDLQMDLSALIKNADDCPLEEKAGLVRDE